MSELSKIDSTVKFASVMLHAALVGHCLHCLRHNVVMHTHMQRHHVVKRRVIVCGHCDGLHVVMR